MIGQILLAAVAIAALLVAVRFRESIVEGVRGVKIALQTDGVSTTKRDKLIDVLLSKEFWIAAILFGGSGYLFLTRRGTGDYLYAKTAIAGMLLSLAAAPLAYYLSVRYISVSKRLVAALDAAGDQINVYVTGPETARELAEETDERVGRRYDEYGNRISLVRSVVDAQSLAVEGLGPRQTPDDDALVADPREQLAAWRDAVLDTFRTVRDELAARPAQQAMSEYETANQLVVDFEQSVSRYGEAQDNTRQEMDSYAGVESVPDDESDDTPEDSLGTLAREIAEQQSAMTDGGGPNE